LEPSNWRWQTGIKSPIEPSKAGALFPPISLASFAHIMGEVNKPVTYSLSRRENLPSGASKKTSPPLIKNSRTPASLFSIFATLLILRNDHLSRGNTVTIVQNFSRNHPGRLSPITPTCRIYFAPGDIL
jgi:hypothetical protein